jgi:MipA family protein
MKVLQRTCLALGFALAATTSSTAQSNDSIQGQVSLGAGLLPDYEGASKYIIVPYLDGQANEGNYFLRFEGGDLQLNLLDNEHFHAGPLLGYRMGRGVVYDDAVSRMQHIRYSITDGGFIEYELNAKDPRWGQRITLSITDGNINRSSGLEVTLRALAHWPLDFIDKGLIAAVETDAAWGDGEFMGTYFGVTVPDALSSGLPAFRANSGAENVGVAFSLDQFLSPKWSVGLRLHYSRLLNSAADSPVTAIAGSPNQLFGGLVAGYVL